ncbi:F-box domain-containing protein [Favolaschia claudopus]|uniref:F-box domain-containing protein n=1 Tax=Favolaschia claudopus TaxID=2862362 RepID=A0AAW0DZN0_9AGAR
MTDSLGSLPERRALILESSTLSSPARLASGHAQTAEEVPAIHRIPTELICEIFTLTLPFSRRVGDRFVEQAPWLLGHICQEWRATAIACPLLWSTITLYAPPERWVGQANPQMMIRTQLNRSGTAPLHVVLDSHHGDILEQCSVDSIDLVIEQCHRWETARIDLHYTMGPRMGTRLARMKDRLPELRSLVLLTQQQQILGDILRDTFASAPRLQTILLSGHSDHPYSHSVSPKTRFPWAQVTKFRVSYAHPQEFRAILTALNPAHVVEMGMLTGHHPPQDALHVVLPRLLRLSARHSLDYITAPSLQELWVAGNFAVSLPNFIQRSACRLLKLVVYDCDEPPALTPVLQNLPALETFFVSFAHRSKFADQALLWSALNIQTNINSNTKIICPKLTHVASGGTSHFSVDVVSFLEMVRSRYPSVAEPQGMGTPESYSRLSFARVFYQLDKENHIQGEDEQIEALRSEGLDIAQDSELIPSRHNYLGHDRP